MVASYGARDTGIQDGASRLRLGLQKAGVVSDVKEYPNARHGFMNRIAVASPLTVLLKVGGVGYDHGSAADAKRRILEFLRPAPSGRRPR